MRCRVDWLVGRVFGLLVICILSCPCLTGAQTVSSEEDLRFGDVLPGVPKTVAKTDPNGAAEFLVTGTEGAEVTIDFDLPLYFSTSGATMPVIFYDTDCAVDSTNPPDQSSPGYDNLNPYSTITYRLGSAGLRIYLGGKIVPGLVQKPGDYSATIRVTVTYTGN